MLYPYRPSSVKNRQRFNFGVLYPQTYSEAHGGFEPHSLRTECLLRASCAPALEVRLRFLQMQTRSTRAGEPKSALPPDWQEAVEREICLPVQKLDELLVQPLLHHFELIAGLPAQTNGETPEVSWLQRSIKGAVHVSAERLRGDVFKVSIVVGNITALENPACSRDEALMHSLVSTHTVAGVEGGEFISLLEPPAELQDLAAQCQNVGVWPVLVGDAGQRDTTLASPIILYDYPQIAPESAGDLFDGTEIDEILSLRILTLSDEEKREIRQSDERARQILERTENMPADEFMKLHGAVRGMRCVPSGPLKEIL